MDTVVGASISLFSLNDESMEKLGQPLRVVALC